MAQAGRCHRELVGGLGLGQMDSPLPLVLLERRLSSTTATSSLAEAIRVLEGSSVGEEIWVICGFTPRSLEHAISEARKVRDVVLEASSS